MRRQEGETAHPSPPTLLKLITMSAQPGTP
jgi:hypothetical protein